MRRRVAAIGELKCLKRPSMVHGSHRTRNRAGRSTHWPAPAKTLGLRGSLAVHAEPGFCQRQIPMGLHIPDVQSVPTLHILPLAHEGHVPPPQSTSVSFPFLIMSAQVGIGAAQAPQMHAMNMHTCPQAPPLLGSEL